MKKVVFSNNYVSYITTTLSKAKYSQIMHLYFLKKTDNGITNHVKHLLLDTWSHEINIYISQNNCNDWYIQVIL